MLHTARAIHSEGPKELGGSRIRTADLKWPKGYSLPYDIKQNEFLRGWKFIFLLLLEGLAGHLAGGGNCLCSASYIHSYIIYIYTYIYVCVCVVITVILFSILVNSVISTHEFYFLFLILSFIPVGRRQCVNDCVVLSHLPG